jgi:hypothetical protein
MIFKKNDLKFYKVSCFFVLFLLGLMGASPVVASTVYVATTGQPHANGLTPATPTDLPTAISRAQNGDVIELDNGIYRMRQRLVIDKSLTIRARMPRQVAIVGQPTADLFTIRLFNPLLPVTFEGLQLSQALRAIEMSSPGVLKIQHMVFADNVEAGLDINRGLVGKYDVVVKQTRFKRNGFGIKTTGINGLAAAFDLTVKGSVFAAQETIGILTDLVDSPEPQRLLIEDSKFVDNMIDGVTFSMTSSAQTFLQRAHLERNIFEGNLANGVNINVLGGNILIPQSQALVRGNFFKDNGGGGGSGIVILGMLGAKSSDIILEANLISGTMNNAGIFIMEGGSATITNNVITDSAIYGINLDGDVTARVAYNTITNSVVSGIHLSSFSFQGVNQVFNNITFNNGSGMELSSDIPAEVGHNNSFGNTNIDYSGIYTDLGGNISVDPLFVNFPTNLHLQAGSPMIGAGGIDFVPTDFDFKPRYPVGGPMVTDIGALEFQP